MNVGQKKIVSFVRNMASLMRFLRKTAKRSLNAVRRVGKMTRRTLKRGTNAVGLTRSRRHKKHGRKH